VLSSFALISPFHSGAGGSANPETPSIRTEGDSATDDCKGESAGETKASAFKLTRGGLLFLLTTSKSLLIVLHFSY